MKNKVEKPLVLFVKDGEGFRPVTAADAVRPFDTSMVDVDRVGELWKEVCSVIGRKKETFMIGDVKVSLSKITKPILDENHDDIYLMKCNGEKFYFTEEGFGDRANLEFKGSTGRGELDLLDYIWVANTLKLFLEKKKIDESEKV